jgi:lipoprotein-releasing system permease protein
LKLALKIAFRYLFGKKTVNAINIITGISILGISIGTAALILILSVFNGFEDLVRNSLNAFNPDIKIVPAKGKFIETDDNFTARLDSINDIESYSFVLEEVAFLSYGNSRTVGMIKGVDKNYQQVSNIDELILSGTYKLQSPEMDFAVLGAGLSNKLGVNAYDHITTVNIYLISAGRSVSLSSGYRTGNVLPAGRFSVPDDAEMRYMLIPLDLAEYLLETENKYSAVEIKTKSDPSKSKKIIQRAIGDDMIVLDRMDQDEELRKIINIERWAAFAIVTLTLLLLTFNMIGSLWIIVIDKKRDISVLQAMGATKNTIRYIFVSQGFLISVTGLITGIIFALLFYVAQKQFGIIGVSDTAIIDSYPIQLRFFDFIIVAGTVFTIGFIVSILPARKAAGISAFLREE